MKKIFLYAGILVASFATVSCNEDFKDWEQPQSIPQGPDKDVVTAAANLLSNTIDYDATETSKVTLLTQSFITGVDAAQLVYSNLKINGVDIPCTSEDGNLIVALDDIKKGLQKALDNGDWDAKCAFDFINEEGDFDLTEAENLLQIITFGEAIYG